MGIAYNAITLYMLVLTVWTQECNVTSSSARSWYPFVADSIGRTTRRHEGTAQKRSTKGETPVWQQNVPGRDRKQSSVKSKAKAKLAITWRVSGRTLNLGNSSHGKNNTDPRVGLKRMFQCVKRLMLFCDPYYVFNPRCQCCIVYTTPLSVSTTPLCCCLF